MAAILSTLQFDYDEVGIFVDAKKIYTSPGVFPISKLFGNYKSVG